MILIDNIAQLSYETFRAAWAMQELRGPLLPWEALPAQEKRAWLASVEKTIELVSRAVCA